ncbi:MAG: DUF61 family protein [Methanomethylovorans sp.]|jgi:hypothetical protein|nr:DUF61 family protein [Methanomethylovorans sp.]
MENRRYQSEDSIFMRWMRTEINKMNNAIVAERKNLSQLLQEDKPSAKTKGGSDHFFEKATLRSIGEKVPEDMHSKLKLPILFFFDHQVPDSCYLNDVYAAQVLQIMGEISRLRMMEKGRLWVGKSIAYSIMKKYQTVVQIVMV